eukprot:scaffold2277_cov256-Pinguiococcus_pyrenoidosus.AAC.3
MPQGWHWGRLGLCEKTQVDRLAERQRREDMTHDGRQLSRAAFSIAFSNGIHGFSSIKTSPRLFPGRRSCAAAFGPCVRPRFVVGVLPRLVGSPLPVRKGKRSTPLRACAAIRPTAPGPAQCPAPSGPWSGAPRATEVDAGRPASRHGLGRPRPAQASTPVRARHAT